MQLDSIKLNNFRNHRELELKLPDFLYISGNNGAGKTSIIESVYLILTLRPFKAQLQDIKNLDSEYFRISGNFRENSLYNNIVYFYDNKRTVIVDNDKKSDIKNYSYSNPVICYSPDYETILSDTQAERRNFIDRIIFYMDKVHMEDVKLYNMYLKRKRVELISISPDKELLQVISEKMSELSTVISSKRFELINTINNYIEKNNFPELMKDLRLSITKSPINIARINEEIESRRPLGGAHKDLIYIRKNGKVIEKFQSYGQKKSCILLLLYYFMNHLQKNTNNMITLLLDDFEAGLDNKREKILYDLFLESGSNMQILITGLNKDNKSTDTFILK